MKQWDRERAACGGSAPRHSMCVWRGCELCCCVHGVDFGPGMVLGRVGGVGF